MALLQVFHSEDDEFDDENESLEDEEMMERDNVRPSACRWCPQLTGQSYSIV